MLSEGRSGVHKIQGIGAGFVPDVLDEQVYDEVIAVGNEERVRGGEAAGENGRHLRRHFFRTALHAAIALAKRSENEGKTIVVVLPDSGDRYYSTPLFAE